MEEKERYKHLNKYLKEKFGERTLKICIDGGFTCPNRDGTKGFGGCIFCSEKGSGEHIKNQNTKYDVNEINNIVNSTYKNCTSTSMSISSISNQVKNYFNSYKAERANKFIAYFQNFTNTYDSIENLKNKYDAALIDDRIVGLEIATRPDCINENIAKLLKSYADKYYVCVELGLQTADEETGKLINRCYSNSDFTNAVMLLNKYNIDVVTHIMIGLSSLSANNTAPQNIFLNYNKSCNKKSDDNGILNSLYNIPQDVIDTVEFINNHNIQGLKIHSCYVVKNTKLETLYLERKYIPLTLEQYLEECTYVITHISPNVIIHRVSGDAPKDLLVVPEWNLHKKWIINGLDKLLRDRNLYQGMYCKKFLSEF